MELADSSHFADPRGALSDEGFARNQKFDPGMRVALGKASPEQGRALLKEKQVMLRVKSSVFSVLVLGFAIFGTACGSPSAGTLANCEKSSDCTGNEVCIGSSGTGACHLTCSVNANDCGGSASCAGLGGVSLNVCKEQSEEEGGGEAGGGETPEPEEDFLRCSSDADCEAFEAGSVCGTWKGTSYCTVTCSSAAACNPPVTGGVSTRFLECLGDEKAADRTICVPREECFSDPASCIVLPTDTGFDTPTPEEEEPTQASEDADPGPAEFPAMDDEFSF